MHTIYHGDRNDPIKRPYSSQVPASRPRLTVADLPTRYTVLRAAQGTHLIYRQFRFPKWQRASKFAQTFLFVNWDNM